MLPNNGAGLYKIDTRGYAFWVLHQVFMRLGYVSHSEWMH